MSHKSILDKASLRAITAITLIFLFAIIIVYLIMSAEKKLEIEGRVDVSQLMTVFVTVISLIIGWLFGRREGAR